MASRFGHNLSAIIRAAVPVSLIVMAAFLVVVPMGCGKAKTTPTIADETGTGSTGSTATDASTGTNGDAINASEVDWSYADISNWGVTATLNSVDVTPDTPAPTICWDRTLSDSWPAAGRIDGNMWVIANIGGKWYGSVWEGIYTGSTTMCRTTEAGNKSKGGKASDAPFVQTQSSPISTWFPQSGEKVCWVVSSVARGARPSHPADERTQILCKNWP